MRMSDCDLNVVTGEVTQTSVVFSFPAKLVCHWVRRYSSVEPVDGMFGFGWAHNLALSLRHEGKAMLMGGAGRGDDRFEASPDGGFVTESGAYRLDRQRDGWIVRAKSGTTRVFGATPADNGSYPIEAELDLDGNRIDYRYDDWRRLASIVDADDRDVRLHYDTYSRVTSVSVAHPSFAREEFIAEFQYDEYGDLVAAVGRNRHPVLYQYVDHRLVSVTNRLGGRQFFAYDDQKRCIARWRSDGGRHRRIRRHESGKLIEVTDSFGYRTLLFLDEQSRVVRRTDAIGRTTEDVYDQQGGIMYSSLGVVGPPCVTTWNDAASREVTSCAGHETVVVYNAFDQAVRVEAPGGRVTSFDYDDRGHLVRAIDPDGADVILAYGPRGNVSRVQAVDGGDVRIDEEAFLIRMEDQLGPLGTAEKDLIGNVIRLTDPIGATIHLEYAMGEVVRVLWPDGSDIRYKYDAEGLPVEARTVSGAVRMESDEFGRPTAITSPMGARYEILWDLEDHYVAITNPRRARATYHYDPAGRLVRVGHFDGRVSLIDYDERDNPVRQMTPDTGTEAISQYNAFDDVIERTATRSPDWSFIYDENAALTGASSALGVWTMEWTREGYLQTAVSPGRTLTSTRDALSRRTSVRDDLGLHIEYTWDTRSRLSSLTVNGAFRWDFVYDPRDLISQMRCPGNLTVAFTYDSLRRMTSRVLSRGSGEVLAFRRFEWAPGEHLTRFEDWRLGVREFTVDASGRLIAVRGGTGANQEFEHDLAGNVLTTDAGERVTVDAGNRALSAGRQAFDYNAEGHIARRHADGRSTTYEYDGDDLLVRETTPSGTVIEHEYDFLARRIAKCVDGRKTHYHWDGCALQREFGPDGSANVYVMLPDSPIPIGLIRDDQLHLLLFDQIGTVTEAFDLSGALTWAADYGGFNSIRESGSLDQPLRALGQYHDRESGLYYTWFRHYDPSLGRFISADPAGYLSSQNLYWYSSNPTVSVDADGRGSFSGTELTLNPRCDWTAAQMRDFNAKIKDINEQIATDENGALRVSSTQFENYDREAICASAVKKWKEDCKAKAKKNKRKVKNNDKPCTDNDADHRRELVLKGKNECSNMTPRNASVNRSCGSQIGNALRDAFEAQGRSLLTIKTVVAGCCKKPDSDATPCIKNKAKWNPNVCK